MAWKPFGNLEAKRTTYLAVQISLEVDRAVSFAFCRWRFWLLQHLASIVYSSSAAAPLSIEVMTLHSSPTQRVEAKLLI